MVVTVTSQSDVAVVTIDNPPVNAASLGVRQGLMDAIGQINGDPAICAAIVICAGRTFVAGADIREFSKPPQEPHLTDVVHALENASKPIVAAIHGSALGGGLEIALGCGYRIADSAAKLGLPEVNLGLIPGAGGTVRLPKLIGASAALDMMASGKSVSANRAKALGLIDAICTDDLFDFALRFARDRAGKPRPSAIPTRSVAYDAESLNQQITKITSKACGQNSPVAVCQAVRNVVDLSADAAFAAERQLFIDLKNDPQSLALRHIFFAERGSAKIDAIRGIPTPSLSGIGVIGGGTMGAGIVAAALMAGLAVTMIERDDVAVSNGQERVLDILAGNLKRGLINENQLATMTSAFNSSTSYDALADADLVIEAVFEDMDVKKSVFRALDKVTRPGAILATNTSYLDVAEIAQAIANPSRVIGLHFFSPAHIMKLLELVIPTRASPQAIAMGATLGKRLGKITVPAGVCDGFIANRIMSAYRRECDYMIEDGALPADVDEAMRDFGFPMGIFEMQDLAGLDIAWAMRNRRATTRSPNERYVGIADHLCEMGRFGRKTGQGWYSYDTGQAVVDPVVTSVIEEASRQNGIQRRALSADQIMKRILEAMHNEAALILESGIARSPEDIDVVMVNGYGFPRWRGGPMFMQGAVA